MSETKDVLREVVNSPWFEWRSGMTCAGDGVIWTWHPAGVVGHPDRVVDCDTNVGFLLSRLREAVDSIYADGEIGSVDLTVNQCGSVWGAAPYDTLGDEVVEGVGPTPCQALAHAILALPGKP